MPYYDFHCPHCDHEQEIKVSIKATPEEIATIPCTECGGTGLVKLISKGTSVAFKGHGWYATSGRY